MLVSCAMSGAGAAMAGAVMNGLRDLYKGAKIAEGDHNFSWKAYVTEKAINAGINLIAMGIQNLAGAVGGWGNAASKAIEEKTREELLKELAKSVICNFAANKIVDFTAEKMLKNAFKGKMQDLENSVGKTVNNLFAESEFAFELHCLLYKDAKKYTQEVTSAGNRLFREKGQNLKAICGGVLGNLSTGADVTTTAGKLFVAANTAYKVEQFTEALIKLTGLADECCGKLRETVHSASVKEGVDSLRGDKDLAQMHHPSYNSVRDSVRQTAVGMISSGVQNKLIAPVTSLYTDSLRSNINTALSEAASNFSLKSCLDTQKAKEGLRHFLKHDIANILTPQAPRIFEVAAQLQYERALAQGIIHLDVATDRGSYGAPRLRYAPAAGDEPDEEDKDHNEITIRLRPKDERENGSAPEIDDREGTNEPAVSGNRENRGTGSAHRVIPIFRPADELNDEQKDFEPEEQAFNPHNPNFSSYQAVNAVSGNFDADATTGSSTRRFYFNAPKAPSAMSDTELSNAATPVVQSLSYYLNPSSLPPEQQEIASEYNKRFKDAIAARHVGAVGDAIDTALPLPAAEATKFALNKAGIKLELNPEALIQAGANRLQFGGLPGKVKSKVDTTEVKREYVPTPLQRKIEQSTGITKPELSGRHADYVKVLQGVDSWQDVDRYVAKVQEKHPMVPNYSDSGVGVRWKFKEGKGENTIRIDKAQPDHSYPSQRMDHVSLNYQGRLIDSSGRNYILYDQAGQVSYKIARDKIDRGIVGIQHGFDINPGVPKNHPGSHIPAEEWVKWKDVWNPE